MEINGIITLIEAACGDVSGVIDPAFDAIKESVAAFDKFEVAIGDADDMVLAEIIMSLVLSGRTLALALLSLVQIGITLALALTGMTLSLVALGAFNPNLIPNRLYGFKMGEVTGSVPLEGIKVFVCDGNDDVEFDVLSVVSFVLLDGLEEVLINTDDVLFDVFLAVVVAVGDVRVDNDEVRVGDGVVGDVRVDDMRVGNNANADSNICSVLTGFSTCTFFGCDNVLDGNADDEIINNLGFLILISALSRGTFCREISALISSLMKVGVAIDVFFLFDDNDDKDNGDDDDAGINFSTFLFIDDFSAD